MKLFKTTYLLYSQSNGNDLYGYLNAILVISVIVLIVVYLPRIRAKQNKFDFTTEFLKLTAYILKSDNKVTAVELNYVYSFLANQYTPDDLPLYIKKLQNYLNSTDSIQSTLKTIDQNQPPTTKLHLLNFLVKVSIIDGFLAQNELKALNFITKSIGLSLLQLESILAMYSFITENAQQNNKQQNRAFKPKSHSKIEEAYKILELKKIASPKAIKKAFRKLVILYHPDKAMHLEKTYQDGAKEMYQKITESYEILKEHLNFK